MAELFDATKQNISLHLKNIFGGGEFGDDSVVKESLTTAVDGRLAVNLKALQRKGAAPDGSPAALYRRRVSVRFLCWAISALCRMCDSLVPEADV